MCSSSTSAPQLAKAREAPNCVPQRAAARHRLDHAWILVQAQETVEAEVNQILVVDSYLAARTDVLESQILQVQVPEMLIREFQKFYDAVLTHRMN